MFNGLYYFYKHSNFYKNNTLYNFSSAKMLYIKPFRSFKRKFLKSRLQLLYLRQAYA